MITEMNTRWSEAVTLEFVKIYLKHECLWNPGHPGYKLKYQRDKAYEEISIKFKDSTSKCLSVTEVKVKIKNLRTTYFQQLNRILQRSNPDSIYEPSLFWFNEMDRCLKYIPTNKHASLVQVPDISEVSQIWVSQEPDNDTDNPNPDPLISNSDDDYDSAKTEDSIPIKVHNKSIENKKNKKKNLKHRSSQEYLKDKIEFNKDDEFDIYGKYIASQLRKMDLQKAIRLQLEIQNILSEARIADIVSD